MVCEINQRKEGSRIFASNGERNSCSESAAKKFDDLVIPKLPKNIAEVPKPDKAFVN